VFLDKPALKQLTGGYTRQSDQIRVLEELGIPYKVVRRELLVLAAHAEAWMENRPVRQIVKPRLDLVR
jgi:hypothetical protein